MLFAIVLMSALFGIIGLSVTKNNARYLLSGYNAMSEEERSDVDIEKYIPYFRRFHLYLAGTFLIIGLVLNVFDASYAGMFLAFFPLSAYIYLIFKSQKYYHKKKKSWILVPVIILLIIIVFVGSIFFMGLKEDNLMITSETLKLSGYYGEMLKRSEVQNVELTQNIPPLVLKTNGFAIGSIKKGYFKTSDGEIIKLIVHSHHSPVIKITTMNGTKIFYSAHHKLNEEVFAEINSTFLRKDH
jgi:hypothetical protein